MGDREGERERERGIGREREREREERNEYHRVNNGCSACRMIQNNISPSGRHFVKETVSAQFACGHCVGR
jgi:hypothetical protein